MKLLSELLGLLIGLTIGFIQIAITLFVGIIILSACAALLL